MPPSRIGETANVTKAALRGRDSETKSALSSMRHLSDLGTLMPAGANQIRKAGSLAGRLCLLWACCSGTARYWVTRADQRWASADTARCHSFQRAPHVRFIMDGRMGFSSPAARLNSRLLSHPPQRRACGTGNTYRLVWTVR